MRKFSYIIMSISVAMLTWACNKDASENYPQSYSFSNVVSASSVTYFNASGQPITNLKNGSAFSLFEQNANDVSTDLSEIIPFTDIELSSSSTSNLSNNDPANAYYGFSETFNYSVSGSDYTFFVDTTTNNIMAELEGDTMKCKVLCYTHSGNNSSAFIPSMVFFFDKDLQKTLAEIKDQIDIQPGDTIAVKYFDLLYPKQ